MKLGRKLGVGFRALSLVLVPRKIQDDGPVSIVIINKNVF